MQERARVCLLALILSNNLEVDKLYKTLTYFKMHQQQQLWSSIKMLQYYHIEQAWPQELLFQAKKKKEKSFFTCQIPHKTNLQTSPWLFTAGKLLACRNSLVMLFYRSDFKNFHLWSRSHKHRIVRIVLTSQFHLNCITDREAVQRTYCK